MTNGTPSRISTRTFSRTFEKMCNFIAVAKIGDPLATVRGLVQLCLLEFPNKRFEMAESFRETIETLFGLLIPNGQIEAALNELEQENLIIRLDNISYRLSPDAMVYLRQAIDKSRTLEDRVKTSWFEELAVKYPKLPTDDAWQVLRAYLCRSFQRHGIQAAALVDPSVDISSEQEASLTSILREAIEGHGFQDEQLRNDAKSAISDFMAALGDDPDRARYISQLADGAFNFYTLAVPADLSKQLIKHLSPLVLFLDTNFLFGILNLHYNAQVQVSHDLLRAISQHSLPFELRYHLATKEEMSRTIAYYGSILRSRHWSQSLSRAAIRSRNLSGIELNFHKLNSVSSIDVDEFLRPYEHFDHLLNEKGIKLFRPHEERQEAQNDLFHEYQDFLINHGRGDKPYETVMHDAKILEEVRHLRTGAPSSLEAGALLISCDYYLYRFDWETSRKDERRACVLLPNIFWQILRPFVPTNHDFEKAFAETFALPEFRAIGSGGARACSKMLQVLASYKDVPEQTAMRMLTNDLLLDRLRSVSDEAKFAEQVEAAFVEENRNLLEEKVALEQELNRLKAQLEEEARKRQAAIEDANKQHEAASRVIQEHEQRADTAIHYAKKAQLAAEAARKEAAQEAEEKSRAEREAFRMKLIAGFTVGLLAIILFLWLVRAIPWTWLISHKNTVPLQIGISVIFLCGSIGLFVKTWLKWCWGVGVFTLFVTLLSLAGG